MNNSIWQTIANTPWWAFVLFSYFMYAGYIATKPCVIPLRKLVISPFLFFAATILAMMILIKPDATAFARWAVMMMLGAGIGWLQFRALKIKAIQDKPFLHVPGTWSVLILFLALFSAKYYFNYQPDFNLELLKTPPYALALMSFYGFFTGLFFGRLSYAQYAIKNGPFVLTNE